ncbi:major facilitator superfamily domain-containing protein 12-like isoform X1 [Tribolium madens]|uniref:major facilitator superfamily domain-containing protein 12-like isoform X1 n=1 Tax=Tribolium madens TaxID=41895 RepID=UPI001CF7567E|nr:major facilitator superfamily domain-containing protein 12-like isoform X1 [Tribolium madens]XP_044256674.1 major facilitator superfamily domain-containing protein 12-like isoform X1 [Tribolium madens]
MEVSSQHLLSNEYTEVYRRLPLKLQLAYGVGHVLNDVCASMWFTYLLVFFHLVLQFNNWQAGFMLLVGQVADAVSTPFVGFHSDQSDNFWLCRYGRRKTWHLVGTVCVVVTFPFIFSPCIGCKDSHQWAQIFYYCVFITIFQFGWASVQISHLSLIPELTPNEHDRTKLTAIRYCFTVVSNLLVYVITWGILHISSGEESKIGPGDAPKFQHVVWTGLTLGIFCSVIFHVFVKEEGASGSNDVRGTSLRTPIADILRSVEVYQVAVVYMSTRLFVNLTQVFIPLYLHETLDMAASALALIPLIMFIGSFITSMTIEKLNRCLGRKLSYILGVIMGVAACIWIKCGSNDELKSSQIYIIAVLIGSGGSITLVTSLGITADLIGDKTSSGAFVYGIMSFTDKLANGIAVVIIQDLHKDSSNTGYYRDVLTYVCGGSALLGALAVISFLKKVRGDPLGYENVPNYNSINADVLSVATEDIQPSLIS